MVVTRTGVSLHLAGTIAEWLGHVLNVITGRMDRPGGRRFEPGYVDAIRMSGMVKANRTRAACSAARWWPARTRSANCPTRSPHPGRGQIRAMVINCGNPVVSGPDGAKLDKALEQLDLLVAIDFVQRESHRHAHWLLPAVHWLERDDLLAFTSSMHDEPYVQYGAKAVEPPPGRTSGVADLRRPGDRHAQAAVRRQGRQRLHQGHPAGRARLTRTPSLEFGPHWVDRLVVATGRKFNGRRIKWRDIMAHPHGWVLGPREFGHFKDALRTDDKKVHAAPPEFVARARELLAEPHPVAPDGYPFQLANRRNRHSMNSWLNELPGLHPVGQEKRSRHQSG